MWRNIFNHKHTVFHQFFLICILIILLPLLVCSTILFSFETKTNNITHAYNSSQLNLARATIDSAFYASKIMTSKLTASPAFERAAESSNPSSQDSLNIFEQLRAFSDSNVLVHSAFVYLKEYDTVISTAEISKSEIFYNHYFSECGMQLEEWREKILDKFYFEQINSPITITDITGEKVCLSYITSISDPGLISSPKAQLVVLFDSDEVLKMLSINNRPNISKYYNAVILKNYNEVLLSENENNLPINLSDSSSAVKTTEINGSYLFYTSSEQLPGIIYASTIEKQSAIFEIMVFYIIYIIFITGLIFILFKANYSPLVSIVLQLFNKKNAKELTIKELNAAKGILDDIVNSAEKMKELSARQKRINDNYTLLTILKSESPITNKDMSFLSSIGLSDYKYFTVLAIFFDESSIIDGDIEEHFSLTHFAVQNILKDIIMPPIHHFAADHSSTSMIVILCSDDEELCRKEALQTSAFLHELITQAYDTNATICIGNTHFGVDKIKVSYAESLLPVTNRISEQTSEIILYSDYKEHLNKNTAVYYPTSLETQLINYVRLGDFKNAEDVFDKVIKLNATGGVLSQETAQKIYYVIYGTFCKLVHYLNENGEDFTLPEMHLSANSPSKALEEIKNTLDVLCNKFTTASNVNKNTKMTLQNIKVFIEKNYNNPNLSLIMISDYLGITPQYLSNFFRNYEGETLSNYITGLRLTKAKELIVTTNLSITEIAKAIGYANSTSFTKMFKKHEGTSPGLYRKKEKQKNL